jgi:acetaldehyde dehydrogenase (acetylating)
MPASRIHVNTPTTAWRDWFLDALPPSMTLGCGSWGGNVTSDNDSPLHLMDIKRVAFETRPVKSDTSSAWSSTRGKYTNAGERTGNRRVQDRSPGDPRRS